jgi:hypothetical protein
MEDASRRDPVALYQFTITNDPGPAQDDVAALLRRVADELDALGAVGVRDITFHVDVSGDETWPSMTVYYEVDVGAEVDAEAEFDEPGPELDVEVPAADVEDDVDGELEADLDIEDEPEPVAVAAAEDDERAAADEDDERAAADEHDDSTDDTADDGTDDVVLEPAATVAATPVIDVTVAEALAPYAKGHGKGRAKDDDLEWFMPPVLERLAPPVAHGDDVLPSNGTPVQPLSSFPVRMPPTIDRSGLKRLRDLLRATSRRRNGID